jgi:hypothetical protein
VTPCLACQCLSVAATGTSSTSIAHSADAHPNNLLYFLTFQAVAGEVVTLVVEVVLVESSTRPTTRSQMAQPTPLSLAKGGQGATDMPVMVPMEPTPPSLGLTQAQP